MKITDIRTAEIKGHGYSTYVRVYTDEGIIGNGECIHGGEGCPAMVHALKQYVIGEDPLDVDRLFEKMRRARLFDGAMAGATVTAMTGIEIALWDVAGKALGVPVYRLLGGKYRDT
ncbi:MAG: mandelate racemase/muconate lactonizing enzyme family protein, partial [Chloroflexia bacterium]|nr:mandelate racemase/muconate lactonizing enzyme family protein [Chloroflexia bacterium]